MLYRNDKFITLKTSIAWLSEPLIESNLYTYNLLLSFNILQLEYSTIQEAFPKTWNKKSMLHNEMLSALISC